MNRQIRFETGMFEPQAGEEKQTNPGRYGAELAGWVRGRLIARGYSIDEKPIPEDWGWVVMVERNPCLLWVGCGNEDGSFSRWGLFVEAEPGFIQKMFKRIDPSASVSALEQALEEIVRAEPEFSAIEWESA